VDLIGLNDSAIRENNGVVSNRGIEIMNAHFLLVRHVEVKVDIVTNPTFAIIENKVVRL